MQEQPQDPNKADTTKVDESAQKQVGLDRSDQNKENVLAAIRKLKEMGNAASESTDQSGK